ncbi:MAG: V-type ATP synthase subunit E [Omnitrophica WOR_2 bacterium]|jgi:V/A-type H+-transporting ATPase subunit E
MENKLQELTQKIYSEGIEKAKSDAVVIIQQANKNADDIIKSARQEASDIIKKANENAKEIKRNADSEIKMASRQAISQLKQQIVNIITAKAIERPVKDAIKDKQFVGTLILQVASGFNNNVEIALPETDKNKLSEYFNERTEAELLKGTEIRFDSNMKTGFKISPKDGNYSISFTDEDFANYFKGFMRPRTVKLLFGEE